MSRRDGIDIKSIIDEYKAFKDIENIEFTPAQMGAILFMIQEEQGEE